MEYLPIYALVGAIAGLLAGMLGIGGGLITVPVVYYLLEHQGISSNVSMHLAVGTSTAAMTLTTLVSAYTHHRRGGILWNVWRRLTPGLIAGAIVGALVAGWLPGSWLSITFGVCEIALAAYLGLQQSSTPARSLPHSGIMTTAAFFIGSLCSILGLGGGLLVVPYLLWAGVPMRESVSTASATGVPITFAGAITYLLAVVEHDPLPALSWGHVYLPAFLGISVASVICAPIGAALSHHLPAVTLRRVFAIVIGLFGVVVLIKPS